MARSDRVKCIDLHSKEPWMLASLYNGNVHIWNYESQVNNRIIISIIVIVIVCFAQTLYKSFEVTDLPGKIN